MLYFDASIFTSNGSLEISITITSGLHKRPSRNSSRKAFYVQPTVDNTHCSKVNKL